MKYRLSMVVRDGVLEVDVQGVRSTDPLQATADTVELWHAVIAYVNRSSVACVLARLDISGTPDPEIARRFSTALAELGWNRSVRLAAVEKYPDTYEVHRAGYAIAAAAGWPVACFMNEPEARDWLLGPTP